MANQTECTLSGHENVWVSNAAQQTTMNCMVQGLILGGKIRINPGGNVNEDYLGQRKRYWTDLHIHFMAALGEGIVHICEHVSATNALCLVCATFVHPSGGEIDRDHKRNETMTPWFGSFLKWIWMWRSRTSPFLLWFLEVKRLYFFVWGGGKMVPEEHDMFEKHECNFLSQLVPSIWTFVTKPH